MVHSSYGVGLVCYLRRGWNLGDRSRRLTKGTPWPEVDMVPHEVNEEEVPLGEEFDSYTEEANFLLALAGKDPLPPGAIIEPGGETEDARIEKKTKAGIQAKIELVQEPAPGWAVAEGLQAWRVCWKGEDRGIKLVPESWELVCLDGGTFEWIELPMRPSARY